VGVVTPPGTEPRLTQATPRRPGVPLATVAGSTTIVVCVSLAAVAYALYPWAFSPMTNWISDLGNRFLSPVGSVLFRLDMVIAGLALGVFFIGLSVLWRGQRRLTKLVIGIGQLAGLVASLGAVMAGIYSEDQMAAHALWAAILFISMAVAVTMLGCGLVLHPRLPTTLGAFAFAVCAADTVSIVERSPWLEWVAVPLLLLFVALLSYCAWRLTPRGPHPDG
jgi:hypothetical protein